MLRNLNFQFPPWKLFVPIQNTGTLLSGARRLQFNLDIVPIEEIEYMAELQEMYYPMFWVEESLALNETYVNPIEHTVKL